MVARLGGWPASMMSLAGARAEGACAAHGRAAVLTVQRRYPRHRRWRHALVIAAGLPVGIAILTLVPLAVLAAGIVAQNAGFAAGTTLGAIGQSAAMLAIIALTGAAAAPGLGAFAPRDRAAAHTWARTAGVALMEASMLVAAPDQHRAATILVRHLLAHADREGVAITARPRTPQVADAYKVLGFAPMPGGNGRILLRPP